jgi:hypothetical protein
MESGIHLSCRIMDVSIDTVQHETVQIDTIVAKPERMPRRSEYWLVGEFLNDLAHDYEDIIQSLYPRNMLKFELSRHVKTIRVLKYKLKDTKPDRITISENSFTCLRTKVQILAEETIGSAVNWWPLSKLSHPFFGSSCVAWSCVSLVLSCRLVLTGD